MNSDRDTPQVALGGWVAPFGDPASTDRSHLPRAFRSVPRPSSPLSAKASTRCPSLRLIAGETPTGSIPRDLIPRDPTPKAPPHKTAAHSGKTPPPAKAGAEIALGTFSGLA